jgi:hypothetical protein
VPRRYSFTTAGFQPEQPEEGSSALDPLACSGADRSEAAACEKIFESRISAIPIPLDVDREEHQVHVARGVGAIQPFEGRVRIALVAGLECHL